MGYLTDPMSPFHCISYFEESDTQRFLKSSYTYPWSELYQSLLIQLDRLYQKLDLHPNLRKSHQFKLGTSSYANYSFPASQFSSFPCRVSNIYANFYPFGAIATE